MRFSPAIVFAAAVLCCTISSHAHAAISSFNTWTKVADPAHPNLTTSLDSATKISIIAANGPIPTATDLGYQSVNGATAAKSTSGFAFSPAASFEVAVDYAITFQSASGGLAIGLGLGEDYDGKNSGGVVLMTSSGIVLGSGIAGRVNDSNVGPVAIQLGGSLSGSLFARYDAATGNVRGGVGTAGANTPSATNVLAGIANNWNDQLLFPAFFVRSDALLGSAWTSGTASIVFTNFRVISGTAVAVPEPATGSLLAWFILAVPHARRRLMNRG